MFKIEVMIAIGEEVPYGQEAWGESVGRESMGEESVVENEPTEDESWRRIYGRGVS